MLGDIHLHALFGFVPGCYWLHHEQAARLLLHIDIVLQILKYPLGGDNCQKEPTIQMPPLQSHKN